MKAHALTIYLPDTRGVEISRFGKGNLKIGRTVYTYSRLPGMGQTCPGSTDECEAICYAKRVTGHVADVWAGNTYTDDVPQLPADCRLLRLHVGGDFDTVPYIDNWYERLRVRPDVTCWAYTRSWRVPKLLPALERLRALANVQLFASMDKSTREIPPRGWRRAWIDGDPRAGAPLLMRAHGNDVVSTRNTVTFDGDRSFICPEETKHQPDCESCGYCLRGQRHDVTFLQH